MIRSIALTAVLAVLTAATAAAATIPKAEYIERVDAICDRKGPRYRELQRDFRQADADSERAHALRTLARFNVRGVTRVRRVPPPAEDARFAETWLRGILRQAHFQRRAARAAARGDDPAVADRLMDVAIQVERANSAAQRFGFERCG